MLCEIFQTETERNKSFIASRRKTMCRLRMSVMEMRVELADGKKKVQKKSNIKARPNIRLNHNLSFSQPFGFYWGVKIFRKA